MASAEITARSVGYTPRPQFLGFHNRDKRWAVIVAHRRAGKTVACIMELLTRALATSKAQARYAYIAPFREQAKTVAWEYLKHYAASVVKDPTKDFRESDLEVRLFNGSTVRLFGADNPNALRGMYLDGVVMDEYADMRPSLWGEVIRPTLSDRKGWAVFIGTPRGRNSFYEIVYGKQDEPNKPGAISDPDWYYSCLKASETGLLPESELADARKTMSENQYMQEYECSFDAAVIGAVYAKELLQARGAVRITSVPYDATKLVNTAWDIGYGDATAIWFYQLVGDEIRVIDYYEDELESAAFYAGKLKSKEYAYDTAYLPHDASNGQSATGHSFADVLRGMGFKAVVGARLGLEEGINSTRLIFPRCRFDEIRCRSGLDALQNYRWDYNVRMGELKPTPVHNWASHGADAFRQLAVTVKKSGMDRRMAPIKYPKAAYA